MSEPNPAVRAMGAAVPDLPAQGNNVTVYPPTAEASTTVFGVASAVAGDMIGHARGTVIPAESVQAEALRQAVVVEATRLTESVVGRIWLGLEDENSELRRRLMAAEYEIERLRDQVRVLEDALRHGRVGVWHGAAQTVAAILGVAIAAAAFGHQVLSDDSPVVQLAVDCSQVVTLVEQFGEPAP